MVIFFKEINYIKKYKILLEHSKSFEQFLVLLLLVVV